MRICSRRYVIVCPAPPLEQQTYALASTGGRGCTFSTCHGPRFRPPITLCPPAPRYQQYPIVRRDGGKRRPHPTAPQHHPRALLRGGERADATGHSRPSGELPLLPRFRYLVSDGWPVAIYFPVPREETSTPSAHQRASLPFLRRSFDAGCP